MKPSHERQLFQTMILSFGNIKATCSGNFG